MHVSRLILRYFLTACWSLVNAIYRFIQRAYWLFNGTANELAVRARPENYGGSGHVMRILFRFKFDEYMTPANVNDFILIHERFENPEYVLQDHISLYQVNKIEAIFVEARPGAELWRARDHVPFMMASQFKFGLKVVRIPIASFLRLAETLGDPKGQIVFLTNTARCGSTLLTQMFEATGKVVAISEPSAINVLSKTTSKEERTEDLKRLIVATVRLLCKPTSNKELAYVLKLRLPAMLGLKVVAELFPKARHLFMYRDGVKVAQSMYRLSEELPAARTLYLLGKGSESRLSYCSEAIGFPKGVFKFTLSSDLAMGAMLWGAVIKTYEQLRESGIDIAAIRYEDIVERPLEAMAIVLRHVRLPETLAGEAKVALDWDSQRNTPLAMSVLSRHKILEYSGRVKEECDRICEQIGIPHLDQGYITPGTITVKQSGTGTTV